MAPSLERLPDRSWIPEEAWLHAREQDERSHTYVPIGGEPPPGLVDPWPRPT